MRALALMTAVFLVGCTNQAPPLIPTEVWNLFPFDGERTWRYVNDDAPYNLQGEIVGSDQLPNNIRAYAVSYTKLCRFESKQCVTGDEVLNILWSSDPTEGVRIHSYSYEGVPVDLRPPLRIAPDATPPNIPTVTTTAGSTWTSVFTVITRCPSVATNDWSCGVFELSSDAPDGGVPLAGTFYAARGQGIVALDIAMDDYGLWENAESTCDGDCNGEW